MTLGFFELGREVSIMGRVERVSRRGGAPLFQKRVGASIIRSGWHIKMRLNKAKWPWPGGKITLYKDRLEIKGVFVGPLVLDCQEIDNIKSSLGFRVRIEHSNEEVPDYITLFGFGLLSGLRETIRKSGLKVRVDF